MKLTKKTLKKIIKEEIETLNEGRSEAFEILEELEMMGVSHKMLLEYLIGNWMSGADALEALQDFKDSEL